MSISSRQKNELVRYYGSELARAIIDLIEENDVGVLYGEDDLTIVIQELRNSLSEQARILQELTDKVDIELREITKKVHELESVIRPDEADVHNINRRIEILAQRVSELEHKKGRGWFK